MPIFSVGFVFGVRTFNFEVSNEPNPRGSLFAGSQPDYFIVHATTACAIESVSPSYNVGGQATAGTSRIPEFIHFCDTNRAPVDFIATHTYAADTRMRTSTSAKRRQGVPARFSRKQIR